MWKLYIVKIENDGLWTHISILQQTFSNKRDLIPRYLLNIFLCTIFSNSVAILVTTPALDL